MLVLVSSSFPQHQEFWHFAGTNRNKTRKEEPYFQNTAGSSATISSRKPSLHLLSISLEPGKLESPSPTQWELNSQPAPLSADIKHQDRRGGRTSGSYRNPWLGLNQDSFKKVRGRPEEAGKHAMETGLPHNSKKLDTLHTPPHPQAKVEEPDPRPCSCPGPGRPAGSSLHLPVIQPSPSNYQRAKQGPWRQEACFAT